jgi:hypothetical protein
MSKLTLADSSQIALSAWNTQSIEEWECRLSWANAAQAYVLNYPSGVRGRRDLENKAIAMLNKLHEELDVGKIPYVHNDNVMERIGVILAMFKDGYDPDCK